MWFFMKVNLGDKTKMPLHIHPDFAEVGLNFGYWVQPVNTIFIERGLFFYDIRLKRVAVNRKSTEGKPCSKDDNHNQYKCVTRLDGQIYTDQKVIDATSGCEGVKGKWQKVKDDILTLMRMFCSVLDSTSRSVYRRNGASALLNQKRGRVYVRAILAGSS